MINGLLDYLGVLEAGGFHWQLSINHYNKILFRGSGGKPFGEGEQGKWYALGAAAAVAFLATITMWEMGYKEIAWKDFVYKYVLFVTLLAVCKT